MRMPQRNANRVEKPCLFRYEHGLSGGFGTFSAEIHSEREIFCDHGSSAAGAACSGVGAATASIAAGDCAAEVRVSLVIAGGATLRVSIGSRATFCSTHLAARPLSGLFVLYS